MNIKNLFSEISGLRYIVENLDIKSKLGQRVLLSTKFMVNAKDVDYQLNQIDETINIYKQGDKKSVFDKAEIKLAQIRDIAGTIKNIQKRLTLNDIELFEVKSFALLVSEIKELFSDIDFIHTKIPNLNAVIEILDPEKSRTPSFYVSNAFDPNRGALRKELIKVEFLLESLGDISGGDSELYQQSNDIRNQITELEDKIRAELSEQLFAHVSQLNDSLAAVADIDILIAKAKQVIEYKFVKPEIATDVTSYKGLFFPELKDALNKQNKRCQPIDIELLNGSCLITGANMAGKTVLLKTLGLSQAMCQFGFFVPAESAKIVLVNQIMYSFHDNQSVLSGLSSYAAEMMCVNEMVQISKKQSPLLLLIDELARTTNPTEGRAIVSAVANYFNQLNVKAVITTHYGGLSTQCRKLRVKGFVEDSDQSQVTLQNIGDFIDYSLIEDNETDVPHEALRIAQILDFDSEIISEAARLIDNK